MISVVICTYNRVSLLERTLTSFFAQTCLDDVEHELIVVDNNSTDDTRYVVESFQAGHALRYVFEPRQGLCAARNRGVAESHGEYVALLDDDVLLGREWLIRLYECLDATGADVVGGRCYLVEEGPLPDWYGPAFRKMLSEVELGPVRKPVPDGRGLFGLNLTFRKSTLQASGPFDENLDRKGATLLGGGETVKVRAMGEAGGKVIYDPDAVVGHIIGEDRLQWNYFTRLSEGVGRSLALADHSRRFPVRLVRVCRSAVALGRTTLAVLVRYVFPASAYQRKAAMRRRITARSRLAAHCALQLRGH